MNFDNLTYEIKNLLIRPAILFSILLFIVIGAIESYYLLPVCFAVGVTLPAIVTASSTFFSVLFPLVIVYLAYVNYARPKIEGSLENILVTSTNRSKLFLSRMISGAIVILISVIAYTFATSFFMWYLFVGVVVTNLQGLLTFIFANFIGLVILYWFLIMISSFTRSQGQYIILSAIVLAIFEGLTFLGNIIPSFSILFYAFTPIGIAQEINSLVLNGFLSSPPIVFWISAILWIILPAYFGIRNFSLIDLS